LRREWLIFATIAFWYEQDITSKSGVGLCGWIERNAALVSIFRPRERALDLFEVFLDFLKPSIDIINVLLRRFYFPAFLCS
jgi:hypothetical protein